MAEYKESEQLTASVIMSSEVVFDLYCEICSEEGKHVEAEGFCVDCSDHLCRECFKIHRKTRVSRHHQLQDKATMPQKKPTQPQKLLASITQGSKDTLTESCEQHPEETVKFYCRDHRVLGCSVCMTVGHRACEGMEYIRDITSDLLASQEYKTFEKELTAMNAKSQDIIKNSKENINKAKKCCDDANTSLKQHRHNVIKAFDKLGRDVKNQTEKLKNDDVKKMKAISEKGKGVVSDIEKIKSDIRKLQENDQLCQLFITMKQANGKLETLREVLQTTEGENSVKTYTFEPGAEIRQIMNSPIALGKITIEAPKAETTNGATAVEAFTVVPADTRSQSQPAPRATTAVHNRDIRVKTATDRKTAGDSWLAVQAVRTSHIQPAPIATTAVHKRDIRENNATDSHTAREAYPVIPAATMSHIKPAPQTTTAVHQKNIRVKKATDSQTTREAHPAVAADRTSQSQPAPHATTAVYKRDITVKTATGNHTAREAYPVVSADTRSNVQPAPRATITVHQKDITVKTATDKKTASEAYPVVPAVTRSHIQQAPQATTTAHQRDITVRTATDRAPCYISGCAIMPNNRLVLTDWNNQKVKLVNLQKSKVTTELKTEELLWDLTAITADQVAVTAPYDQEIVFVKVAETLSIDRKMKVNGYCNGIVYGKSKLFVLFDEPCKIEILTLDGVLENKMERDSQGNQFFAWPLHIALSPDSKTFYVSDWSDHTIKRITLDGSVIAVYKDKQMSGPKCLVVHHLERLIVCGTCSNNIHMLNLDCTKIKVLLSGLSYPTSLCFSQQTGLLYVGQANAIVKVYQLS